MLGVAHQAYPVPPLAGNYSPDRVGPLRAGAKGKAATKALAEADLPVSASKLNFLFSCEDAARKVLKYRPKLQCRSGHR